MSTLPDQHSSSSSSLNSVMGPMVADLLVSPVDYLHPFAPLGGGDPGELEPVEIDADELQELAERGEAAARVEVARHVVAIAGMAAGDQHSIPRRVRKARRTKTGSIRPEQGCARTRMFGG